MIQPVKLLRYHRRKLITHRKGSPVYKFHFNRINHWKKEIEILKEAIT